jgi:hypothetical protein
VITINLAEADDSEREKQRGAFIALYLDTSVTKSRIIIGIALCVIMDR